LIEQILSHKTLFFDIVTTIGYALSPAMNKSLHAALVKICTSGGGPLFHSSYNGVAARKMLSMQSIFHRPEQMKSEGAKSGLYGGCGKTVHPRLAMCSTVFKLVWGLALLGCKRKVVFFSGLTLEIRAFSLVSFPM